MLPEGATNLRFSLDRGGTFTDVFCAFDVPQPDGTFKPGEYLTKLLSVDPKNYDDAPREGIRRLLDSIPGKSFPRGQPLDLSQVKVDSILMATTVATNALLERQGARTALVITSGFRDLLAIGNQSRPLIFDLQVRKPGNLYETVVEVDERVILVREGETLPEHEGLPVVTGTTGEKLVVERAPDAATVRAQLAAIREAGITSLAVAFLHSYTYPAHEALIGSIAAELGFTQISLSSSVMPMVKIVPRGFTTCADAYLSPHVVRYLTTFRSGFVGGLGEGCSTRLLFMQSDGGLVPVNEFSGHRAVLSGPAGGVVGYAQTAYHQSHRPPQPVVAFDMGGTSTDVSRYAGSYEITHETTIAGVQLQAPQLDISTVAAGGGSRLFFRSGLFAVGPESAGAHPGPVCYRKGGHLAVTDANLQLGRIVPEAFPHIFGPAENEPLDVDATAAAFASLAGEINAFYGENKSTDEIAYGFLKVANEAMCRPIRALTQMKGYDITTHVLACFGGAGPQHACAIAKALGIRRIFVSRYSGVLSAYGLSLADVVSETQAPVALTLVKPLPVPLPPQDVPPAATASAAEVPEAAVTSPPPAASGAQPASAMADLDATVALARAEAAPERVEGAAAEELATRLAGLAATVGTRLAGQGFSRESVAVELYVNLRYQGTDSAIMVPCAAAEGGDNEAGSATAVALTALFPSPDTTPEAAAATIAGLVRTSARRFVEFYRREFGFVLRGRDILVDDVRVRGIGRGPRVPAPKVAVAPPGAPLPAPWGSRSVFFEGGRRDTPVYALSTLRYGDVIPGPAMLIDKTSTIVIEPGFVGLLTPAGDVEIEDTTPALVGVAKVETPAAEAAPETATTLTATDKADAVPSTPADPITLSIFSHRFMGIAEQMGRVLQRTSISVNMRERLDYSCALFSPTGALVANAPHIPVHLGAMQDAVRFQVSYWGADLKDGDVLVSNHPQLAGGSHLPDITVITPVFSGGRIVFFVASRGHHADIGGIAPGSMPPGSKTLAEEGAAIVAFKLVKDGVFQEAGVTELLLAPGKQGIPGCTGSRNLRDCISDLRAQVAANHKGIQLVRDLIAEYGLETVHAYMGHIQANAELAVRDMLVQFSLSRGLPEVGSVRAVDFMDDGTPIALCITINRATRSATFDFTGTGPEVYGNHNAPKAVTASAVIFCLRALVDQDIPLNQGCLTPVDIIIPSGTLLNPSSTAAVVGGNVLTSQRCVDVILKAFGACAASQGCMNNFSCGRDRVPGGTGPASEAFGLYETIAGGCGAGPTWHGTSGTHSACTNTRITDVEIMERRYPLVIRSFTLRSGSGGIGRFRGGDGVVREFQFRTPLIASILSERRVLHPFGAAGGGPGARGLNTLLRADGRRVNLGGRNTVAVAAGERLRIETPGGGGYGTPDSTGAAAGAGATGVSELWGEAEFAAAYAVATTGALPPPAPTAAKGGEGIPGSDPSGAGAAFLFSGSVGKYKEAQEGV